MIKSTSAVDTSIPFTLSSSRAISASVARTVPETVGKPSEIREASKLGVVGSVRLKTHSSHRCIHNLHSQSRMTIKHNKSLKVDYGININTRDLTIFSHGCVPAVSSGCCQNKVRLCILCATKQFIILVRNISRKKLFFFLSKFFETLGEKALH